MYNPYIIAEIGSNWATLEDCMNSIALAKNCGASAVKFQLYDRHALYGRDLTETFVRNDGVTVSIPIEMPGQLPLDWLPKLAEKATACGIDFMCSAFSPELIDAVDPYVKIHKVASAECTHLRMLEKLRRIGKPVLLSTGGHGMEDIKNALRALGDETPVTIMYCESAYPAKRVYLPSIGTLSYNLKRPVGFSDHTTDVLTIPWAACKVHGAVALEKHVNFVGASGPDSPHSITGDEFKDMVAHIRSESGEGVPAFGPTVDEKPMLLRHNRRMILTRDVMKGGELIEGENFGIYRSLKDDTRGASPFMFDHFKGTKAKRDLSAGDGLWIDDCED